MKFGGTYTTADGWIYVIQPLKANDGASTKKPKPKEPTAKTVPVKKCYGLDKHKNHYLNRDILADNIKTYCSDSTKQGGKDKNTGAITRRYNIGTPEEVTLEIEWPGSTAFKPSEKICNKYLGTEVMDGNSILSLPYKS